MQIPISQIIVAPERQRKDMGDLVGLVASIRRSGLISPITVSDNGDGTYKLQAGERRLRAHIMLQLSHIDAKLFSELSTHEQELIELEENVRRKELTWQELVRATARFVELAKADGATEEQICSDLQLSKATISKMRTVAKGLDELPRIAAAASWSAAYNAYTTEAGKRTASVVEDVLAELDSVNVDTLVIEEVPDEVGPSEATGEDIEPDGSVSLLPTPVAMPPKITVAQVGSFLEWAPAYSGRRFNLIHCDFPYGLNMDTANLQASSARWELEHGRYDDSPELFDQLCRTFFDNQDRFIAESAHCIFWLAHKNFGKLWSRFKFFGWVPCEVPLIWHKSDNSGIAPDVRRQPRRTYEIAIFATRGDRPIVKVKAASCALPPTKEHHLSEKPLSVVSHFLEMVCDEHSELLDPTCGSGTALDAAARLGARRVFGLDTIPRHVAHTNGRVTALRSSPSFSAEDLDLTDL